MLCCLPTEFDSSVVSWYVSVLWQTHTLAQRPVRIHHLNLSADRYVIWCVGTVTVVKEFIWVDCQETVFSSLEDHIEHLSRHLSRPFTRDIWLCQQLIIQVSHNNNLEITALSEAAPTHYRLLREMRWGIEHRRSVYAELDNVVLHSSLSGKTKGKWSCCLDSLDS